MPTTLSLLGIASLCATLLLCLSAVPPTSAQAPAAPQPGPLPEVLTMADGTKVTTAEQWRKRRSELLALFVREMYGQSPAKPAKLAFKQFDNTPGALGGKATRRQVTVYFDGEGDGPHMDILMYLPSGAKGPLPAFVGLNFQGNHAINADPGIRLSTSWMERRDKGVVNNRATEESRGATASRWPVEMILSRGYAVATIYAGDIDPDFNDGFKDGVQALYPQLQDRGDNFATVAAWAWGLGRALDYFETDKDIDAKRVAVIGHSRMGKAALWAGATDERFAMAISNDSGAGGAKLFRRDLGEKIKNLNTVFPHWFCGNFQKYNDQDTALGFDQHMVIALCAPRPVYIASAEEDKWADPEGEFLAAKAAEPVYRLLGTDGLPADAWPAVGHPVAGRLGYHVRPGKHDITDYDWTQYLNFADKHLKAEAR